MSPFLTHKTLNSYLSSKTGFSFIEKINFNNANIKYKKGHILIEPGIRNNRYYTIVGFIKYSVSGYLRYIGELKDSSGVSIGFTSRGIKEVDSDYKLSLNSILKEL